MSSAAVVVPERTASLSTSPKPVRKAVSFSVIKAIDEQGKTKASDPPPASAATASPQSGPVIQPKRLPWLEKKGAPAGGKVQPLGGNVALGDPTNLKAKDIYNYTRTTPSITQDDSVIPRVKSRPQHSKAHSHLLQHHGLRFPHMARHRNPKGAASGVSKTSNVTSDYSASPSSDGEAMPLRFPKKDPASYERLVSPLSTQSEDRRNPFLGPKRQHKDSSPDDSVSPGDSSKLSPAWMKTLKPIPTTNTEQLRPQMRRPMDNRPRHQPWLSSTEESSISSEPMPPRPVARPTLRGLPDHLMAAPKPSARDGLPRALDYKDRAALLNNAAARSGPLNRAVTGLENLMEEALYVARDAAKSGRPEEVATVLNNATLALRKASSVQGQMDRPLVLSSSDSMHSDDSDMASAVSSLRHSRENSVETAPTVFTKSAKSSLQPVLSTPYTRDGRTPVEQMAVIDKVGKDDDAVSDHGSISHTPPRLYATASAESVVRDFAYPKRQVPRRRTTFPPSQGYFGLAADYYGDQGQSVETQPGIRRSIAPPDNQVPPLSLGVAEDRRHLGDHRHHFRHHLHHKHHATGDAEDDAPKRKGPDRPLRRVKKAQQGVRELDPEPIKEDHPKVPYKPLHPHTNHEHHSKHWQLPEFLESTYYRLHERNENHGGGIDTRNVDGDSDPTEDETPTNDATQPSQPAGSEPQKAQTEADQANGLSSTNLSLRHPRRNHLSLKEDEGFSLGRYHRRQPIAREWNPLRKAITATIACLNTIFVGLIAGIYAGEVPRLQYQLADMTHWVITGNVVLFACLGLSTLIFWPLPLLHGRKPYVLLAFAVLLPLQFPQALVVSNWRPPKAVYRVGLLLPRALTGFALGFANVNFLPTLFDLFGASLMSERPHQELVLYDDVRRQGGGMGMWLGIWTFCFSSSLSIGFTIGACIISKFDPSWGFYLVVILLAVFLLINVIAPETRRSPYRRSIAHFFDDSDPERLKRRIARGEIKLHISNDGPKWWFQEVWAGLILTKRMLFQPGFFVLMSYLAWLTAELVMVIVLLGALLSRDYRWQPQWVGLAALAIPLGALLAMPLTKASWLSRSRDRPPRTDSMTFQKRVTWTSHLLRRTIFSLLLPFAALGYCLSAPGPPVHWAGAVVFAGVTGFLTDLGIAECVGLIMETFDTCDLQPGTNTKHRLQSMSSSVKRRRTNYSSFPRVCAGFFAAQSLAFFLAAIATYVSGRVTNAYGAQTSIAIVAGILLFVTIWLLVILWRWKEVQVIPNYTHGTKRDSQVWGPSVDDPEWKPVVIGNPSGKVRRMNLLETGTWTRWSEIRRLNKLAKEK